MSCPTSPRTGPEFDPDFEGPSDEDIARFGGDEDTCPECGVEVYHDVAMCPSCGSAIADRQESGAPAKPWIGPVAIVAIIAFAFAVLAGWRLF